MVRGGRYGISIAFGLEAVEKQSVCGTIFESKFVELTKKLKLTIASPWRETDHSARLLVSNLRCRFLRAHDSVRRKAASF